MKPSDNVVLRPTVEMAKRLARRVRGRLMSDRQPDVVGLSLIVERFMYFGGRIWVAGSVTHPEFRVDRVGYRLPEGRMVPVRSALGTEGRFEFDVEEAEPSRALGLELVIWTVAGYVLVERLGGQFGEHDPYHLLVHDYFAALQNLPVGRFLEIGSRNRSGNIRRDLVGADKSYVGLDVHAGENVDVVGDAHDMTNLFDPESFDSVFSISTFEHLAMPWKVVLEINRVLVLGGTVMVATHQTWPLHEQPWDFWRFSADTWPALFNRDTGFEVERVAMGEPASIVPHQMQAHTVMHPIHPAMLGSAVICRKTGPPKVRWDTPMSEVVDSAYPE